MSEYAMDAEAAIKYMRSIRRTDANWILEYDAIDKAIEALEKQVPKKPKEDDINRLCPICGNYVGFVDILADEKDSYCYNCGQKLKWSNDND